jgi:hypothetical protein
MGLGVFTLTFIGGLVPESSLLWGRLIVRFGEIHEYLLGMVLIYPMVNWRSAAVLMTTVTTLIKGGFTAWVPLSLSTMSGTTFVRDNLA